MVFALLIESDVELDRWRDAFRNALGSDGGLIVDLIPPLKIVIGEQPPVPELPPNDAKRRFHSVFSRFLMVFAQEQHPLTIFLDDLQWADLATLDLIESLLLEPEVRHLLLLGAYRDNEVDPLHPVVRSFDRIRSGIVTVRDIVLQPLSRRDTGLLVANSLNCEVTYATELSNLDPFENSGQSVFSHSVANDPNGRWIALPRRSEEMALGSGWYRREGLHGKRHRPYGGQAKPPAPWNPTSFSIACVSRPAPVPAGFSNSSARRPAPSCNWT